MTRPPRGRPEPDKPTPKSVECENCAIGAMLMLCDGSVTKGVRALHVKHFSVPDNATVFDAISKVERRRQMQPEGTLKHLDIISVSEQLRAMGRLQTVEKDGGIPYAYLRACVDLCPSAENIDYYIGVVIEKSRLRYLAKLGERMSRAILEPGADSNFLYVAGQNALQAINAHGWCDLDAIFQQNK